MATGLIWVSRRSNALLALACVAGPLAALGTSACNDDATPATDDGSSTADDTSSSSSGAPPTTTTIGADDSSSGSGDSSSGAADSGSSDTGESTGSSSSGAPESSSSGAVESSSDSGVVPLECPVADLDPTSPDPLFGNTTALDDDFSGSCGGEGSPDAGFTFTAPADGLYTFDTHGSQLDTVLYLLDGTCGGSEIACNDDGDDQQSALTVALVAGQSVTVVVDGNQDDGSPFQLRVRSGSFTCPAGDLGSAAPTSVVGDNSDAFDAFSSSCNGGAGPEDGWLFTAPNTATYSFDTFGSSFESVVYIRDGSCAGPQIGCGSQGALVDLVAGQQVTVFVDSHFELGSYELHVDTLGGACPDDDLGSTLPQTILGDTADDGDNTDSASCGGEFSPDDLYEFTAPSSGLFLFDTIGSELDTVLYTRQAGCGGEELDCNDDFDADDTSSRLLTPMAAGQTVLIGVDGNGSGAYTLNLAELPCPEQDLGNVVPQTVFGNTNGGFDKLRGSCTTGNPNLSAPDDTYSFTAPEDGEYVFDTNGSSFNTVLYALDGDACNAPEVACSNDFDFQQTSALSVPMLAGETVSIVVDGNFTASGSYQLNVDVLGGGVCPDVDLGSTTPSSTAGDTSDGDNTVAGTCGGFTQPDDTYLFTADQDGLYVFDTFGSAFDTILIMRDGGCDGPEIGCNDDTGFFSQQSQIAAQLTAGQTVMVAVDGNFESGDYTLNAQFVTCPDEDLDDEFPVTVVGTTVGAVDKLDTPFCSDDTSPDFAYEFTAPADGLYSFDTQGSSYDTLLILQDLACGGEELACNDDFFGTESFVSADLVEGQTVIVVVSGFNGNSGPFTLNIY